MQPVLMPAVCAQREALAVVRVEGLYFERHILGLGQQGDTPVCHRPVHVHEKHLNSSSAFLERRGYFEVGQTCLRPGDLVRAKDYGRSTRLV